VSKYFTHCYYVKQRKIDAKVKPLLYLVAIILELKKTIMRKKHLISLAVLTITIAAVLFITLSSPSANRRGPKAPTAMSVEIVKLISQPYQVTLDSYGRIAATVQGQLNAQVAGKIVKVSDSFNQGSFFKRGEVLVTIDSRDYDIRVEAAQAELATAQVAFDEEKALSAQAIKDRKSIGTLKQASDFALRKPQMAAAKAKFQAASANLKQALLDVERTNIIAPYDGRVLAKYVDLGQVISSNTNIADIFATQSVEVSLSINNAQLGLVNLPHNNLRSSAPVNTIELTNSIGGEPQRWRASKQRTTANIDNTSQQLSLIAQIDNPFGSDSKRSLNIGQFVTARITGKTIDDAIVIANSAIYQGNYVYLYANGVVERRNIEILFQNKRDAVIKSGLSQGETLITTPLGQIISGTKVKLLGEAPVKPKTPRKRGPRHVQEQG